MRILKRKNSYYLQHSFRKQGKIITKEILLGKAIPPDIEQKKIQLFKDSRKEAFYLIFDKIKYNFKREWKNLPALAREKAVEEYSIYFTYNTNAIEGSTITEYESREIISKKISPNKPLSDVKETEKHAFLFKKILSEKQHLTSKVILDWHKHLFTETKPDIAGKFRDYPVRVGDYKAPDWQDIPILINQLFAFAGKEKKMHSVELSARVHYQFEKIHPFGDGNGRIGRLIMNNILWYSSYPILIIEYKKRKSYYRALKKDEEGFVQYFIRRYLSANRKYLE